MNGASLVVALIYSLLGDEARNARTMGALFLSEAPAPTGAPRTPSPRRDAPSAAMARARATAQTRVHDALQHVAVAEHRRRNARASRSTQALAAAAAARPLKITPLVDVLANVCERVLLARVAVRVASDGTCIRVSLWEGLPPLACVLRRDELRVLQALLARPWREWASGACSEAGGRVALCASEVINDTLDASLDRDALLRAAVRAAPHALGATCDAVSRVAYARTLQAVYSTLVSRVPVTRAGGCSAAGWPVISRS